jgi:phosphohistidine phosphatase
VDLLVVRHALAWERDPARWPDDGRRPLRPLGIRRFRAASRGLARLVPHVDAVWTSPLVRAVQTARILHEEAGWPAAILANGLAEDASPLPILRAAARASRTTRLVVVGHAPNLNELVAIAICGRRTPAPIELRKGGVAYVRFEATPRPGSGTLVWVATPRLLRALDD